MPDNRKKFRILSIDGGGIRGIIPGQILVYLERKLQEDNPDARLSDYFDLIAGTSTGGILTCAYLAPDDLNKEPDERRPKFTAQEAVDLYLERGDEVFDVSLWQRIRSAGGVIDEKYSADELEEALSDYFGDTKLSDLLKPCLVTAYDIRRRETRFFTQATVDNRERDFFVRDVARATSAAPTYFEVARIKSLAQKPYPFVDGGVFANNPTLCAYAEARTMENAPKAADMVILSLGTGKIEKSYEYKNARNWGKVEWIVPVLDIMMSGVAETVDYQLKQIYDAVNAPGQYVRIEPSLGKANPDMDDASAGNLTALRDAGLKAVKKYKGELDRIAGLLVAE